MRRKIVSVALPNALRGRFEARAAAEGVSLSCVLRRALTEWDATATAAPPPSAPLQAPQPFVFPSASEGRFSLQP